MNSNRSDRAPASRFSHPSQEERPGNSGLGSVPFLLLLLAACSATPAGLPADLHLGPAVAPGASGPGRYVEYLYSEFDLDQAMERASIVDLHRRTAGSPAYNWCVDLFCDDLAAAGFGRVDGLHLDIVETQMLRRSWTGVRAELILERGDQLLPVLSFQDQADEGRVMLPEYAPTADVRGIPVFSLGEVGEGTILVTEARLIQSLLSRARKRGALAIVSSSLFGFTTDPTGQGREQDAILATRVNASTSTDLQALPVLQISPRAAALIKAEAAAAEAAGEDAYLILNCEIQQGARLLRTIVATIDGSELPGEAVAICSNLQGSGAGDNGAGSSGILQSAVLIAQAIQSGAMQRPRRSLQFVWGDGRSEADIYLEWTDRKVIAGLAADMLSQSHAETGAIMLLERMQDPGALFPVEPDRHTPWGGGNVSEEDLTPNGLALIARMAIHDVARCDYELHGAAQGGAGWSTAENPWEGGSDHDHFLEIGIPAVLFWHFTDFTYHTSLDRIGIQDPTELRRSCTAVIATALAVASPLAGDIERYRGSLELERELRITAARAVDNVESVAQWEAWCGGAGEWLEAHCSRAGQRAAGD